MASPDYDVFVVDKSNQSYETPFIFKDKQYVSITDSNQGVYSSGQVQFDLTQISSSSLYFDAKASYLELPFTIQVESDNDLETYESASEMPVIMKNGAHNLVNSMEVYLSGQQFISAQSFSNVPVTYKMLTTTSPSDLKTVAPSLMLSDETDAVHTYEATVGHTTSKSKGFSERQKGIINPENATYSEFVDAPALNSSRQPYATKPTNKVLNINMVATIPLAHLHDFFQQLPLIKGSYLRLALNLNLPCSVQWANSSQLLTHNPTFISTTQVIPFQLNLTRDANNALVAPLTTNPAAGKLTISSAVGNAFKTTGCAIHCAMCEFTPMYSQAYLKNAVKTIKYIDFLSYNNLTNIQDSQFVQHQVTSGLGKLRHMLIVPQLSRAAAAGSLLPITSPYCSAPSCTAPFSVLTNFNVSVSGKNLYQTNIQYSWEHWLEQISYMGGIDGNPKSELGVKAGLISEADWQKAYRFIYVNLSNKNEAEDEIPRSVSVTFTNRCKKPLDFYIFLFYEREIRVDCATGQLMI
jgi:hypothetical protein